MRREFKSERFKLRAEQLKAQARAESITGTTEVSLVMLCQNEQGNTFPPATANITPRTMVRIPGDRGGAARFTAAAHLETILENIDAHLAPLSDGLQSIPGFQVPVRVLSIELQILNPAQ